MNVHKKMVITMQPNSTTDVDQSPNHREVRLFYRDGRIYDYGWTNDGVRATYFGRPNAFDQELASEARNAPRPRARKYLMVRAFDPTYDGVAMAGWGSVAIGSVQTNPTIDVCIRKCERFSAVAA